jgi:meso-butanediol dehydrogenase/(S,S)-butanediol dehydrogenase/diacetyl reductase
MIRFDGKVVLVTGGTAGFGLSIARLAQRLGARVAVSGRRQDRGREAQAQLGGDSLYVPGDVAAEADVERMVAAVVDRFGRLDVLVNNAGMVRRFPAIEETTAGWDAVMDVNLRGVFTCCRHALPHLIAARGAVVNISSVLATRSQKGRSPAYDASKAGVEAFTRALACQYGPHGVRANAVAPGFVETELTEDVWGGWTAVERTAFIEQYPLRRLGTSEDVAHAVLFLASEAAGWITGVSLIVDGGRSVT